MGTFLEQNIDSKVVVLIVGEYCSQHCPLLCASSGADSPLMVMPSSIPRLLGSFTWKVPLLGTTDSDQVWKNKCEQE